MNWWSFGGILNDFEMKMPPKSCNIKKNKGLGNFMARNFSFLILFGNSQQELRKFHKIFDKIKSIKYLYKVGWRLYNENSG